jgi:hypothetical protein
VSGAFENRPSSRYRATLRSFATTSHTPWKYLIAGISNKSCPWCTLDHRVKSWRWGPAKDSDSLCNTWRNGIGRWCSIVNYSGLIRRRGCPQDIERHRRPLKRHSTAVQRTAVLYVDYVIPPPNKEGISTLVWFHQFLHSLSLRRFSSTMKSMSFIFRFVQVCRGLL